MTKGITRRNFIKDSSKAGIAIAGVSSIPGLSSCSVFKSPADIVVVQGEDYFGNTLEALEMLGGIEKFVPKGSNVGLLINSDFENFGTYVNPDIAIAVVKELVKAGASEITCLQVVKDEYWKRSRHYEKFKDQINSLRQVETNTFPAEFNDKDFVIIDNIDRGKSLKETEVVKKWLECDVFVNLAISKHHMTTLLTGALKNIMGVSTRKANVTFHLGSGERNDPEYIAQCIADQNALRKTDLCIIDSTEFILDNGPSGPGTLEKLQKIVAGTDIVALDALTCTYLGYSHDEILTVVKAHEIGIGDMHFEKLNIIEQTI
ncbi:MAG: DUF362 domain-containing protein [Bacteroidales bacterium]|nr:DUF362 domain-containing protein [Bacteroidales bacterium]MCF8403808.1 DUF362 domain-containing protein [Bacteroidales bacterium]